MDDLPVGSDLVFDIAAVREQYRWSSVASQFADACIARLDAGASAQDVQYRIVRGRAQEDLSWAYGGTPVKMWTYVEPTASAVAVGRKKGSKQRRVYEEDTRVHDPTTIAHIPDRHRAVVRSAAVSVL